MAKVRAVARRIAAPQFGRVVRKRFYAVLVVSRYNYPHVGGRVLGRVTVVVPVVELVVVACGAYVAAFAG